MSDARKCIECIRETTPCIALKIIHSEIKNKLESELEAEKVAGPFPEEWAEGIRKRQKLLDELKEMVNKCEEKTIE